MNFDQFKNIKWSTFQRYLTPGAMDDANAFLEKLPQNTSKTLLIVTGVIWSCAAALGLFTTVKMQEFAEKTMESEGQQALLPVVPTIRDVAIRGGEVPALVEEMKEIYKGLQIQGNASSITITANSTGVFGQFREAIGHVQNGGEGWRVSIDKLCVGKECGKYPLGAILKINKVSVENVTTR